ncbi:F0F1 ATP synthase subunit gamma [Propionimicrobium sp. PCR01-08-3]|uniref:F0F1 ATP synthase subunit gamma n=1 Tax=Propionimicrobium sp. PCR01-08-3 TaxID=3052086 RepID=UPI00255C5047|nr:F0F1 ATP synthase subunit gamma [Propionimicrobium sp. PCR01-08-3]WIY83821.1 F0F1 ATP synthase subunit gamma [Propionimicrobium sp. PCR01-08-3]
MAATLRELRERRNSVAATMKITKAMELIAASRVNRAESKAQSAQEFTLELHRAVDAVATFAQVAHPLTLEHHEPVRSAVLVLSSDRGLAGAYPGNITRAAEGLIDLLQSKGVEIELYTVGKKAQDYFAFHGEQVAQSWTGFSEAPHYEHAREIGEVLMQQFLTRQEDGGVGDLHVVYTQFNSLVSQKVRIVRLLPLQVVGSDEDEELGPTLETPSGIVPDYEFEPDAETVLDALLPMYIIDSIKYMLRQSAASELASRQQAMHSATDNAQELIRDLTRQANQARQAEITQEINEIVGGAGALSMS